MGTGTAPHEAPLQLAAHGGQARVRRHLPRALMVLGLVLAAAAALAHVVLLLSILARRWGYPLDLEWMEGGMLCHALRVMEGHGLYQPPSVAFIPYLYTPLYPYLLAGLGKLFGLSYGLGRALSWCGLLVACAVLVRIIWRETPVALGGRVGRGLLALLGLGLFAASFPHTGAWYDLVRNDSLYLGLVASGLYLLAYHQASAVKVLLAGVLLGLAFLTKQTSSIFILFAGAATLLLSWRRLVLLVPSVGLVAGVTVLVGNHLSAGWLWRYTFELHQGHDLRADWLWPKTELRWLKLMPASAVVVGLWMAYGLWCALRTRRLPRGDARARAFWFALVPVGVAVSAVGFSTQWAVENAFIPAFYFTAIFAPIAFGQLVGAGRRRHALAGAGTALIIGGMLALQLLSQLYKPAPHLPTQRDRAAVAPLLAQLARYQGPLLIPYHPFYAHLLGKRTGYHQMGINDITRAGHRIPLELFQRLGAHYYDAVVLDSSPERRRDYGSLLVHYKLAHYLRPEESPAVVTGYRVRPLYIFVPKRSGLPLAQGARQIFDFEDGSYRGWQLRGQAFGLGPAGGPSGNQGLAGPYRGRYLASSYVRGDRATGSLLSPPFSIDQPWLSYRIGGGRDEARLALRLLVDGVGEVHRATGRRSHLMERRWLDVSKYRGQTMRLELLDQASGGWGHLLFDDLQLNATRGSEP